MPKRSVFLGANSTEADILQQIIDFVQANAAQDIMIKLETLDKSRSKRQNAYYWGVVIPAIKSVFTSYGEPVDDEEAHIYAKVHIGKLKKVIVDPDGEKVATVKSTSRMTTQEFEDYMTQCRQWASAQGVFVAMPNESIEQWNY